MVLWWYDPTGPANRQTGDWQKACSDNQERGEQDQRPHSIVVSSGDPLWNSDVRLEGLLKCCRQVEQVKIWGPWQQALVNPSPHPP